MKNIEGRKEGSRKGEIKKGRKRSGRKQKIQQRKKLLKTYGRLSVSINGGIQ
jgi:hypothetical protein